MREVYTIFRVDEPEFGCEGPLDGEPINGTLWMRDESGQQVLKKMDFNTICKRRLFEDEKAVQSEQYGLLRVVEVSAALIVKCGKLFATQRGYGDNKGKWEFPGGKLEKDEKPEDALVREIKEELNTTVTADKLLDTIEFDYPDFHLRMHCFLCTIVEGGLELSEHLSSAWLCKDELYCIDWLPADIQILEKIRDII